MEQMTSCLVAYNPGHITGQQKHYRDIVYFTKSIKGWVDAGYYLKNCTKNYINTPQLKQHTHFVLLLQYAILCSINILV